jgi:DNA-binding GntR family transcriptional regulator
LEGLAARLFAENASEAMVMELEAALDAVVLAYQGEDGEQALDAKTRFYDLLYQGGASETLASMLGVVQARVWRWRAVGLTHPDRADDRLNESVGHLRLLIAAIRNKDGDSAENIARREVSKAAEEVMRLIAAEQKTA